VPPVASGRQRCTVRKGYGERDDAGQGSAYDRAAVFQGTGVRCAEEEQRLILAAPCYPTQSLVSGDQSLLDQRSIHPELKAVSLVLDVHLGLALHGQDSLKERRAEAVVSWLIYGWTAVLSPFQMKLPGTPDLIHVPSNLDVSAWNRKSPVPDGIRGEFMEGHADRYRQISR
jgi:hypothetical protein